MEDLFTIPESSWSKNNNSVPVVAGNNATSITRDVSVQHNVVATAGNVQVQQQVTKSIPLNVPPTTEVSVQQSTNPVLTTSVPQTTANVQVQQTKNISTETDPVVKEDITPVAPSVTTGEKEDVEEVDYSTSLSDNTDNSSNYSNAPTGVVDAISLMEMEFPSIVSIVENLLNVGIALLASMPKLGKSWFCLLLCIAVATGKEFLGFTTNKCEVLYLSFESTFKSLQNRMRMLLQGAEIPRRNTSMYRS